MTTMPTTPQVEAAVKRRDELADRLFAATLGAQDLLHVYLGDRLGLYAALARLENATSVDLAVEAHVAERYAREWLEQQAVTGILDADDEDDPLARRYSLPTGHDEVLLDETSLTYFAPLPAGIVALARALPSVLETFRSGGGVPFAAYGPDMRDFISRANKPMFLQQLASRWIPALPDVERRLTAGPARVADFGCGTGWSSIAFALAYPLVSVDGFDSDESSVVQARENAGAEGVSDRVTFHVHDASDPGLQGAYELVTAFESLHDMADPVGALATMRRIRSEGATVLVVDEKVAETFTAPGDEIERFTYGWSALHCLPAAMTEPGSEATGTVMRPETLRRYAREAGFADVEIVPVDHDLWRFYRLVG